MGSTTVIDKNATIEKFLEELAAKKPTPGGGAVAALTGALSTAIGEMVLNYSVGKKGLEEHQEKLKTILAEFHRARSMMLEWMIEDQEAYEKLTSARKSHTSDVEEGLLLCVNIPLSLAATAAQLLKLAEELAEIANPYLLSDLAVCAELAMATVRTGVYNVRVNLKDLKGFERERIDRECHDIVMGATESMKRLIPAIWSRI
jgi:formiminotetrahydrofolate cyclodeaminase